MKQSFYPFLLRLLTNSKADQLFKNAGIPKSVTSVQYNFLRVIAIAGAMILSLASTITGLDFFTRQQAMWVIIIAVLLTPRPFMPATFILMLLGKRNLRAKNQEVYSFYMQLKAEFKTNHNLSNVYSLLHEYRHYFKLIRPAIEIALAKWSGPDGASKAWDAFSEEVGTPEAKMLAKIMKDVELTSPQKALEVLEQKRQEFANRNYNSFKNYLKDRETIIYFVIYVCAFSSFANPVIAQILQYRDIMKAMNNI